MERRKFIPPAPPQRTYEIADDLEGQGLAKTVLLLEDDAEYAAVLKEYLESFDYSVTVSVDGVQGMKRIMERDYDVIVCDLLMPNLPGDMFYIGVERVKPALAKRFVFITGHQNNPKVSEFLKKVRALCLFKPFELPVLLETIGVILKNTRKAG